MFGKKAKKKGMDAKMKGKNKNVEASNETSTKDCHTTKSCK